MQTETQHPATLAPSGEAEGALWNPHSAVLWSFFFTPAFGSFVHMLNWSALGEPAKAARQRRWFYASLGVLALDMAGSALSARLQSSYNILFWLAPLFMALWYGCAGQEQVRAVKQRFGTRYPHKSWRNILCAAVMAANVYVAVRALVTFLLLSVT